MGRGDKDYTVTQVPEVRTGRREADFLEERALKLGFVGCAGV